MKIVKIFGLVIAAHVVAFAIFLLAPGCQSSPRQRAEAREAEETAAIEPVVENWSSQGGSAGAPAYASSGMQPVGAPLTGLTPGERARATPIRPDNPDAFIATGGTPQVMAPPPPPPPPPATHTVMSGESLWTISRKYGINVPQLTKANPGLKGDALQPGQVLKLPAGVGVSSPAAAAAPFGTASSMTSAAATSRYVVRSGDSLSKIAARNGTTVAALKEANNLRSDVIQVGSELIIPASQPVGGPSAATPAASSAAAGMRVTVAPGENLGVIARRFQVTVQELMQANGITDARKVRAGQEIVIPGFQPVGAGVVPASTTVRPAAPLPRPIQTTPAPVVTPPAPEPAPAPPPDLDTMLPADSVEAPVVPVDEPMPRP